MRSVGYWYSEYEPLLPRPTDFVDKHWDPKERDAVIVQLKNGEVYESWRGWAGCRICGCRLGTRCMTDGAYVWPEKLEHYLEEHQVKLPQDFINHVLAKQEH